MSDASPPPPRECSTLKLLLLRASDKLRATLRKEASYGKYCRGTFPSLHHRHKKQYCHRFSIPVDTSHSLSFFFLLLCSLPTPPPSPPPLFYLPLLFSFSYFLSFFYAFFILFHPFFFIVIIILSFCWATSYTIHKLQVSNLRHILFSWFFCFSCLSLLLLSSALSSSSTCTTVPPISCISCRAKNIFPSTLSM